MYIAYSVKFFAGEKGTIPEFSFQNPRKYKYTVDVFGNAYFSMSNGKDKFSDFDQIKLMVFEFLKLNSKLIKDIKTSEERVQLFISIFGSCQTKFSYMFSLDEIRLLDEYSVKVEIEHYNVAMD